MKRKPGMTFSLEEFNNELPGNDVEWRIINNAYRREASDDPFYFVYRRVDRGDGLIISEYLQTDGTIDHSGAGGWFKDLGEIGAALIANASMAKRLGDWFTRSESYRRYISRFRPGSIVTLGSIKD